jgi:3-phenylpropionate/trans-cinnamate dioxygenase ferredoxin reductase subunit
VNNSVDRQTIVIVGAGQAGGEIATALRQQKFEGRIVLIGEEPHLPYKRPPLSKGYLQGKDDKSAIYVHEEGWYATHDVDLRLGVAATSLDPGARQLRLSDGSSVGYDQLLLATGASPRRLRVPGADLGGVHVLRTAADSERLRAALSGGGEVVIAGAGWIGLEVAAAARQAGCEVTVVEPEAVPLHHALGPELGRVFADLHAEHGVAFRFGEGVSEFAGSGGQVTAVVTTAGARLPARVAVVGIGAVPNTGLAGDAGLDVANGVLTDAALRTSVPGIWAAGDVANIMNPLLGRRIRVEHWANALHSGPAAARSMLGREVSYDRVPYFFSDQYDLGMETSGVPEPGGYDQVVYRGDREGREFIAFWLSGGKLVAGMNVNVWDVTGDIQDLIRSGRELDPARLSDPGIPLAAV